jgi:glyoxylase-like metal-dependent hydrolase (beta-lactamase superfamily II)
MLPIFEYTDTDGWIDTWSAFLALGADIVIPGHGGPTDYDKVTKYTRDYLQYMRDEVGEIIDNGGELQDAYGIDQTKYSYLDTYFELARQNSGRIFREMEFE